MMGMLTALALQAAAADPSIRLRCDGHADGLTEHTGYRLLQKGGLSTTTSFGHRQTGERVLFELVEGQARLHLPKALITAVNSGGEDGWWPVADLKVTDEAISGRIRINVINKPSFRIDRYNGDIDLQGLQPFRGQCESRLGQERKF